MMTIGQCIYMTNSCCISMFSLLKKAQLELKRVETHLCNNSEKITSSLTTTKERERETRKLTERQTDREFVNESREN